MAAAEISRIEKLKRRNYQLCKYNMKLVLMERDLWGFTQEGQETPRLRSDKAYSLIALNVEKDVQVHISSITEPLKA